MDELLLALLVSGATLAAGMAAYRLGQTRFWLVGYFAPLALVLAVAGIRQTNADFDWPWSLIMTGRREFALLGMAIAVALLTPLSRLPDRRNRRAVVILVGLLAGYAGVYPFLSPALSRSEIAAMQTRLDPDGVCLQQSAYTCGPAAAVTVLRRLGLENAGESELALACGTSPAVGTPCDQLSEGIARLYPGTACRFARFQHAAEVPVNTLVVVRLGPFVDHYVAVLERSPGSIVVGDPLCGKRTLTPRELEESWRGIGLILSRRRLPF